MSQTALIQEIDDLNTSLKMGISGADKEKQQAILDKAEKILSSFSHSGPPEEIKRINKLLLLLSSQANCYLFAAHIQPEVFGRLGKQLVLLRDKESIESFLEIFRSPFFLKKVYNSDFWPELILNLVRAANYTFPTMFSHRVNKYKRKILFRVLETKGSREYNWTKISNLVSVYSRGLYSLLGETVGESKIAFFTKNSLDMALFDLACLTGGIVNVMIPANSVPVHIEYILKKTRPSILIISNENQLSKIRTIISKLSFLKTIIIFDQNREKDGKILGKDRVAELGKSIDMNILDRHVSSIKLNDLATIMFTSGTTGNPKGIQFSHENIVYKRFARAMALPDIGEDDSFLSYLPLFHTFGRWFEMTGTIFWGACYNFMENPAPEVMIENMQRIHPSIFISIPKKWYQLYELISKKVNIVKGSDEEILLMVNKVTGGKLKWGLSAAGHLDIEVFQFFQQNGIELMSGFGMTEATGGITMTPPGKYKPGSLGKALPGIKLKLGEDGELLIHGAYVMMGYVNPEESDVDFEDGWLPTGDIMEMDEDGFIKIIDRKKEIYKNIKGETIAPQKIENYFRDFEFIQHVFLVGDNQPNNTLLIYPNYDFKDIDFRKMSNEGIRSYFSSVIVSVNRFLASFERIVNFTIIDRDFDPDKNELTPKGTYRRKVVESNFAHFIQLLYQRNYYPLIIKDKELRIPNWFLREKGLTPDEIKYSKNQLFLKNMSQGLTIKIKKDQLQLGDFLYEYSGEYLDFSKFLTVPSLWLGNSELVTFTTEKIFKWFRTDESGTGLTILKRMMGPEIQKNIYESWKDTQDNREVSVEGIHYCALLICGEKTRYSGEVLSYLERAIKDKEIEIVWLAKEILERTLNVSSIEVQRKAFILLLNTGSEGQSSDIYHAFLDKSVDFINSWVISEVCTLRLDDRKLEMLFQITRTYCKKTDKRSVKLFRLLSRYGAIHPTRYKIIRQFLASCQLDNYDLSFKRAARVARYECRDGFRKWLGSTQEVAVDIETGEEYHWEDVVIFEETTDRKDRERLLAAIKNTTLIREAIFLFSKGILVRLNDIPPGGVWISLLGAEHGKAVYRITIQTRYQGSFDIAVNVNHSISFDDILEEINWLIQAGTRVGDAKLVEDFGGYWDEFDLWSEEFIQGETAGKFIARLVRQRDQTIVDRLRQLWPYFIWSGVSAYLNFWMRTKCTLELKEPSPQNIIIPKHDYQTGSRIVSIASRRKHIDALDMLKNFMLFYVEKIENEYLVFKGIGQFKYIFSGVIEALGHKKGIQFLDECLEKLKMSRSNARHKQMQMELKSYLSSVRKAGFIPKRLYFAIKRYHRWHQLNNSATDLARAATLSELYETYALNILEIEYPETRTRFFKDTVFAYSGEELKNNLDDIIKEQQKQHLSEDRFTQYISNLRKSLELSDEELFFLARLSYPHLQPTDSADLILLERGGVSHTDLILESKDYEGGSFYLRTPVNPKEIARLHQLFLTNNLSVQFKPEHLYLVAINERSQLIGGLFYRKISEDTAHIEKIVVAEYYRKKGVSDGILNEFFKRMVNEHYYYVTTGFFRPEYFYRFGFKIERKYAGLVKKLVGDDFDNPEVIKENS